ncbi:non-ribosomal peptide synthetase [Streptomyces albiaxialis]|uniref:Non-ribosomal peptide synthetase n=1 Tax=Streptomyces albiaxialis TaxID=329523 RepID=A0ABP5H8L3_9ACTN
MSVPASFAQQRLWFLSQLPGANAAYNEPMAFTLRGPLDPDLLRRALDTLTARHETLRTRLVAVDGEVRQIVGPPGTGFALETHDLTALPADAAAARLAELRREDAATPFDLARGPLARGALVALAPGHHVLLLTIHHTVFDGQSMNVMLDELGRLYAASRHGAPGTESGPSPDSDPGSGPDPLPPLPLQYAEHTEAQRSRILSGGLDAQAAYWEETLRGAPPLSDAPADRPRPAEQDHRGGRVEFALDAEVTAALRALARRRRGTLFTAVLTGWTVLLSRLSGRDDLVVGTPTAGRRTGEVAGLIGFFVNSLPLRVDLSGEPTAEEALSRVRGVLRGALDHQDLPFERIVEAVNPPRGASHTPLFQTMCAWVPGRDGLLTLPGVDVEPLPIPHAPAKFDLALSVTETGGRVIGHLDYAEALFDRETAERYARHLRLLLTDMAARPGAAVGELELMDDGERQRLLADWDASAAPPPPYAPGGLVERFAEQVRTRADRTALVCGDRRLDYATLGRRAARLARALTARGVRPGRIVALHTGRTPELAVGVLGVLMAGAAYLPLDPAQPRRRLAAMVEDAAPALVLSDHDRDRDGAEGPAEWLDLAAVEAEGGEEGASPPVPVAHDAARLAYVLYTSGSTGRPKGVAVTHGSVLNLFDDWLARMGGAPGEAASAWSSIGFDASVHELLMPLTTGGELHLVPEELRADPEALMEWLREHRVVQAFLPPAFVRWIDEDPEKRLAGLSLRQLLTGVESLPEAALHRMRQHLPDLRIRFGYGPTEATLYTTAHDDPGPFERQCPIGRPLAGTRMYLLDARMRPVPPGVTGEVYVGGASLAAGYLHRPDLTDERFLPDPFVPGARVYRTGDLARRLPDGTALFLGRADDQVKLRGFRIEPAEIEAALLTLPGVREAAVVTGQDASGEPCLVAGVGRGERPPRPAAEWRAALAELLPDYMIPARVVDLPALPLGRTGKLDRAELLRQAAEAAPAQVNVASPRDRTELVLYEIWRSILLHTDIGVRDSFFDIGGTSLSGIKMVHAVQERLGVTVPVRDLVLHPTIEDLAALVRRGGEGPPPDGLPRDLIEFRPGATGPGGAGPRVVCVHPAGGTAFCYLTLAKELPDGVGLYGIQSPGIHPGEDYPPTVEAMARAYLALLEPLGLPAEAPLVLTGLSYGGLVAHEMGRLLAEAGRRAVSVVLLDTQATDDPAVRAAVAPVDMVEFRDKLVKFNGMYPGIDDAQIDQYHRIYNHHRMTARDHVPAPTPARTVLAQAAGDGADPADLAGVRDFWRRRARGGFHAEPLDCGHWEVLESGGAPRVARLIQDELTALAGEE